MPKARGFWGAIGLFVGLLVVAIIAAPRIEQVTPSSDSPHVSASAAIRIEFSRKMDRVSVESRFVVSPEVPGEFSWQGNSLIFKPVQPWAAGTTVEVSLLAGARSVQFIPILGSTRWSLEVGQPRLSYLWPADEAADLYVYDLTTGRSEQITESEAGILDYTVAGATVVYVELAEDGTSSLRSVDLSSGQDRLLLECPPSDRCSAPALDRAGQLLAYERFTWQNTESGQRVPGPSGIWLLSLSDGGPPSPIAAPEQNLKTPLWASSGILAYYNGTLGAVGLVRPGNEIPLDMIPNGLGLLGSWSPDGRYLVLPEIRFASAEQDDQANFYSHLYRIDVLSSEVIELTEGPVEDASPSYSPDGEWIAFARKYLDQRWTPGRQLWLMQADGSQAHQLSSQPDFGHAALSWSPDSATLVYMQRSQVDANLAPQIWIADIAGQQQMLVEGGYLPQWLP